MAIQVGDRVPEAQLRRLTADGLETVSTSDLLAGRRVVLFGVPGAFTPACSDTHLPGYVVRGDEIRAKGIDEIVCVAVNDAFVMDAWGKARDVGDSVTLLSDGNGDLARAMGLELDGSGAGLGSRNQRYAAVVDDGVVKVLNVEPDTGVSVSSAESVLAAL